MNEGVPQKLPKSVPWGILTSPPSVAMGILVKTLIDGYALNPAAVLNLFLGAILAATIIGALCLFYIEYRERGRRMDLYLQNWVAAETRAQVAIQVAQRKVEAPL